MKNPDFDEEWEPRIGKEAARTSQSALQYVRPFFISWALTFVVAIIAIVMHEMPLWLSILGSISVAQLLVITALTWSTFSIRRRRAGRQAYEYLGRPPQLRKGIFPPGMLRDVLRFDSFIALKGIAPKGNYTPTYDPGTARILAKRNKSDRTQGQQ